MIHKSSTVSVCTQSYLSFVCCVALQGTTNLVHFLLPLSRHGGTGGVSSVGDGVEDLGGGAAGLVDIRGVPPGQNLLQGCRYHAVLIAGDVDYVATERLELQRNNEG